MIDDLAGSLNVSLRQVKCTYAWCRRGHKHGRGRAGEYVVIGGTCEWMSTTMGRLL
jgi:hypothetical protein